MTIDTLHDGLLRAFACVEAGRDATYVSGPITTGRRFMNWYSTLGHRVSEDSSEYRESIQQHVIRPNERDLLQLAKRTRESVKGVVIEPTHLKISGWTQREFHQFWTEVVSTFCSQMIVVEGWEYSAGCAIEFRQAIETGIRVYDPKGHEVSSAQGRALMLNAIREIELVRGRRPDGPLAALETRLRESAAQ